MVYAESSPRFSLISPHSIDREIGTIASDFDLTDVSVEVIDLCQGLSRRRAQEIVEPHRSGELVGGKLAEWSTLAILSLLADEEQTTVARERDRVAKPLG